MADKDTSPSNSNNPITQIFINLTTLAGAADIPIEIRLDTFEIGFHITKDTITMVPTDVEFKRVQLTNGITMVTERQWYEFTIWGANYENVYYLRSWLLTNLKTIAANHVSVTEQGGAYTPAQSVQWGRALVWRLAVDTQFQVYEPQQFSATVTTVQSDYTDTQHDNYLGNRGADQ